MKEIKFDTIAGISIDLIALIVGLGVGAMIKTFLF